MSIICKWTQTRLSITTGNDLSSRDKEAIDTHLSQCESCRQFARTCELLKTRVAHLEAPSPGPFRDRQIIHAAVEGRRPSSPAIRLTPRRRWPIAVAIASGVAVSLLLLAVFWMPTPDDLTDTRRTVAGRLDIPPVLPSATPVTQEDHRTAPMELSSSGNHFVTRNQDRIWRGDASVVWLKSDTPQSSLIHLVSGTIVVQASPRQYGDSLVVETDSSAIIVTGTVFSVTRQSTGVDIVRVLEGTVSVEDKQRGHRFSLTAGQQLALSPQTETVTPEPAHISDLNDDWRLTGGRLTGGRLTGGCPRDAAPHDEDAAPHDEDAATTDKDAVGRRSHRKLDHAARARDLLSEMRLDEASIQIHNARRTTADEIPSLLGRLARGYRQQKNYRMARATYEQLIEEYGQTRAGQQAKVALGQMLLGPLNTPDAALDQFENYLTTNPTGYLRKEALLGQVRSLLAIGRNDTVRRTVSSHLSSEGMSDIEAELRWYRATAAHRMGSCSSALSDYQRIMERWPRSIHARRAASKVKTCRQ